MASQPLTLDELVDLADGRPGVHDVACPLCGPDRREPRNRGRPVLRVWLVDKWFGTWFCARCGSKGEAHTQSGSTISAASRRVVRDAVQAREHQTAAERLKLARFLWGRRQPLQGSIGEVYLRDVRCYGGTMPSTLGFLPARGDHPPAMIAAFGVPRESEPGLLAIDEAAVFGVHITRLLTDGSGKVADRPKIMIGKCMASPIVLAPMNDALGLAITEGIEDALSIHEATGLGAWAAGAASRLPALGTAVPAYADAVSVFADADEAGRRFAGELQSALLRRQIPGYCVTLADAA